LLGDNFIFGNNLENIIIKAINSNKGASIFSYAVSNPQQYGVLNYKNNKILNIVEKPKKPSSNKAVPGIYIYDKKSIDIVKRQKPSKRGELEITDLNNAYIKKQDIEIFNLLGEKLLESRKYTLLKEIDISVLPKGLYIIKLGEISNKFVKTN